MNHDPMSTHHAPSSCMLSVDDVAILLDVSVRHIWRMRSAGIMPQPVRLGSAVRWRKEVIEKWIEAGCPFIGAARFETESKVNDG